MTSNSWEYSGDGQALAYLAGADLIDMEFVQFHPTGMVWPPGVRGLLVTEAVRGEGGILRNKDGERFMWGYLPDDRRHEYAATADEAADWVKALGAGETTDARRPPELSTRDNVARAIYTEVKEGRGSPHGGVFLDISYLPADHVRRKLPSMYEQFKELADVDITAGPMEVGPDDPLHDGRDPGRRRDRCDDPGRACTQPARSPPGCTAPIGSAGTRCRTCSCSVSGPGRRRRPRRPASTRCRRSTRSRSGRPWPSWRRRSASDPGEDPYRLHEELRSTMQSLVGIFRTEADLHEATGRLAGLHARWPGVRVGGGRAYNPGWGLVFELRNMLIVAEAIARSARQRTESRGAHSRIDFPGVDKKWSARNSVVRRDGETMTVTSSPLPALPDDLRQLIATE